MAGASYKFRPFQIHEKVTLLSVTEYIYLSRGVGNGVGLFGSLPRPTGLLILLAKGLWFQSSEAVFGSWLACGLTGHSGSAVSKCCSLQCTLLRARIRPGFRCSTIVLSCLQVGLCFCMGRNVEMWRFLANGQRWAISYWSDSFTRFCDRVLVDSSVGPNPHPQEWGVCPVVCEGRT